jgi:hypothetical protein
MRIENIIRETYLLRELFHVRRSHLALVHFRDVTEFAATLLRLRRKKYARRSNVLLLHVTFRC